MSRFRWVLRILSRRSDTHLYTTVGNAQARAFVHSSEVRGFGVSNYQCVVKLTRAGFSSFRNDESPSVSLARHSREISEVQSFRNLDHKRTAALVQILKLKKQWSVFSSTLSFFVLFFPSSHIKCKFNSLEKFLWESYSTSKINVIDFERNS